MGVETLFRFTDTISRALASFGVKKKRIFVRLAVKALYRFTTALAVQSTASLLKMMEKPSLLVSHGCALRCYLCHALGLPLERIEEIPLSQNTAVSRVIYDGCEIQVDYYDDLSHLEPKINQEVSV